MATYPNKPVVTPPVKSTAVSASTTATPARPYTSPIAKKSAGSKVPRGNQTFLFDRNNYLWMAAGLACILLGFILMSGGKSPDPHKFNYEEIYSFRRITFAPLLILIGFGIEVYAIMKKRTDTVIVSNDLPA